MIPGPLGDAPALIQVHALAAILAVALSAVVLGRPKGTRAHRWMGWGWIAAMVGAAGTAVFIHEGSGLTILGWGPFGPIHLLVLVTASGLAQGIWHARRGNVVAHRKAMRTTYLFALVVAGAFTLLPGRRMSETIFGADGAPASMAALAAVLALAGVLAWRWSRENRRTPQRPRESPTP